VKVAWPENRWFGKRARLEEKSTEEADLLTQFNCNGIGLSTDERRAVLDIRNLADRHAQKTGTRFRRAPVLIELDYLIKTTPIRALRSDMGEVGKVEIVRARSVKVDPTLHDPIRIAWV
jgi:hypothetical protein